MTSGTLLLLGQRYHFYLTRRGVAHITQIDGKWITSCTLTQQSSVRQLQVRRHSLPAWRRPSQRLTVTSRSLLSLLFKAQLVWECVLKALFSTVLKTQLEVGKPVMIHSVILCHLPNSQVCRHLHTSKTVSVQIRCAGNSLHREWRRKRRRPKCSKCLDSSIIKQESSGEILAGWSGYFLAS